MENAAQAKLREHTGHEGEAHNITGPQALGRDDVAAMLGEVSGGPVEAVAVGDEAFVQGLGASGVPEPAAREIASYGRAIREGYLREASGALENLTGRTPRPPREAFEAHRHELPQGASA